MKIPKNSPTVLFRDYDNRTKKELKVCEKYFVTVNSRMEVSGGDIVVGRYSVLPFYKELERDLKYKGAKLINSYSEHHYVSDLKNWASDYDAQNIYQYTPKTWFRLQDVPDNIGAIILKGETNSIKNRWSTHMFASNKKEAIEVYTRLREILPEDQEIYIREFINFKKYFNDPINNQPIIHEFRFFCYKTEILAGGFYWSNHVSQISENLNPSYVPIDFLKKIANIVSNNVSFYTIDVAQCENGNWMVVELNDAQSADLSETKPDELYKNLKYYLWDKDFDSSY